MLNGIGIGVPYTQTKGLGNIIRTLLFSNSEVGVWYDPSDFTTMFQDSAGTTPVTAVEQPVGNILDKSGNGNHATQATSTARPVLRADANGKYYLDFDGVDDYLGVTGIFQLTPDWSLIVGEQFGGGSLSTTYLPTFGVTDGSTNYAQLTRRPGISSGAFLTRGASALPTAQGLVGAYGATNSLLPNTPYVHAGLFTAGLTKSQINETAAVSAVNTWTEADTCGVLMINTGTSAYGETRRLYSAIAVNRTLSESELASVRAYVNSKTGAY